MFYTCFISASPDHITWLRKEIRKRIHINGHVHISNKRSLNQLKYAKADSLKLLRAMYYSRHVLSLTRKKIENSENVSYSGGEALKLQCPPGWRNWYPRSLEVAVGAIPWRFKSSPGHKIKSPACAGLLILCPEQRNCLRCVGGLERRNKFSSAEENSEAVPRPLLSGGEILSRRREV